MELKGFPAQGKVRELNETEAAASMCLTHSRLLPLPTFLLFNPGSMNNVVFKIETVQPLLQAWKPELKSSLVCWSTCYNAKCQPATYGIA